MSRVTFIVEGWSDHDQLCRAYPDINTIVTNGTRFNNRIADLIQHSLMKKEDLFILSDPDIAGDQLSNMVKSYYPLIPRIYVDPEQAKCTRIGKSDKYGVEYCSVRYLRELLGGIMNDCYTRGSRCGEEHISKDVSST